MCRTGLHAATEGLLNIARLAEGLSGRALRKLPFQAHAFYVQVRKGTCSLRRRVLLSIFILCADEETFFSKRQVFCSPFLFFHDLLAPPPHAKNVCQPVYNSSTGRKG